MVAAKVDPISFVLIFENVTTASGYSTMGSAGLPGVVGQGPRATPGAEALGVVGYVPSSHSMPLPESSQMLNTSTMPPYCAKALVGVMSATLNAAF